MSNEKIIDNNDEMRLDGMSEVNIDKWSTHPSIIL